MKLKKGDKVIVQTGKNRGTTGKILHVLSKENRIVVEGVNIVKRHEKNKGKGKPGGIIEAPSSIHASNVMIVDPKDGKPSRIGKKKVGDKYVRVSRKSGQEL